MMIIIEDDVQRFWAKVLLPDENGCMPWAGAKSIGYGKLRLKIERAARYAHRISATMAHGEAPPGRPEVAHLPEICHNPSCVAPDHLRWATHAENQEDRWSDATQGRRRYSNNQIEDMRSRYAAGESQPSIASLHGCSQGFVSMVVRGKYRGWPEAVHRSGV